MAADTNLQLNLPDLTATNAAALPVHPKQVRAWLHELPLADHEQAADRLRAGIANANRQPLAPDERLTYLEAVDTTAGELAAALHQRLRHHPLPLSSHGERVAHLIRDLHRELAVGYKRVLLEDAQTAASRYLSRQATSAALFGAMVYLGELLLDYFQTYQLPEAGIWRDLHQLYRHAERRELLGEKPASLYTGYGRESNLQRLYLRLLLLTLASPYRLRQGELEWVNESLEHWVEYCEVRTPPTHETGIGILAIDLDSDEPGDQPLPASESIAQRFRLVVTTDLLPVLRKELTVGHEQGTLPTTREGTAVSADIYRRLTQAWGTSPQRSFSRSERAHNLDVTVGFDALYRLINAGTHQATHPELDIEPGDRPRAPGEYVVEPHAQDVWSLVYAPAGGVPEPAEPTATTHRCGTINESAGGFCLVTHRDSPLHARVGELVGIRDESARGEWEIGVIRWMRDSEDTDLEFGVQMIAPYARAIETRVSDAAEDAPWEPALILPEVRAVVQPVSLIVRDSKLGAGTELRARSSAGEGALHLSRALESTGNFAHFQCTADANLAALFGERE